MHFFSHFGVWKWQKYLAAHFGGNIINRQMCNSFAQKKNEKFGLTENVTQKAELSQSKSSLRGE